MSDGDWNRRREAAESADDLRDAMLEIVNTPNEDEDHIDAKRHASAALDGIERAEEALRLWRDEGEEAVELLGEEPRDDGEESGEWVGRAGKIASEISEWRYDADEDNANIDDDVIEAMEEAERHVHRAIRLSDPPWEE